MILDGLTTVGDSVNGYGLGVEELLASMTTNGIDRCVVAPALPENYRLETRNDAVAASQEKYPEQLIGLCRLDPRRREGAIAELRRCILRLGLRGLMLHPMEEGYRVNEPYVGRVLEEAGSIGVPVVVAAGFPWVSHALQVGSVAHQVPETTIVMTHGGHINISGLAQADALLALREHENLHICTNRVYRQDYLEECVASLGAERVLFASMSPVFHQGFELDRARAIRMDESDRSLVLGENMLRLLGDNP